MHGIGAAAINRAVSWLHTNWGLPLKTTGAGLFLLAEGDEEDVAGTLAVVDRLLPDAAEETYFAVFTVFLD